MLVMAVKSARTLAIVACLHSAPAVLSVASAKPPFKVLFSNDTTNITSCSSPYHQKGQDLTDEMIRATVDEVANVDVHMLQPGMGWIPWWKSKVYPAETHYRWHEQLYGIAPNTYGKYMINGGDVVATFVRQCRLKGVIPFISLRLNDGHGLEYVGQPHRMGAHCVSQFYERHPEYRIGPDKNDWNQRVHNWAIPEVREHKFALIREICENYDIDGFELDFMRHPSFFQLDKTTDEQRRSVMTAFVARVRRLLDRTRQEDRRRWLCVRVPAFPEAYDDFGLDLPALVEAGVDMINLSSYFFTVQQTDLPRIRRLVPEAAIYLEMTHCTAVGPSRGGYDSFSYRRTTDSQFCTTAHLAYRHGADGVSLFNFVYYREHGEPGRGPFNEPPFHVLRRLGDPAWLAQQPQWYVFADTWNQPKIKHKPLPHEFKAGDTHAFSLALAPVPSRSADGVLRLMTKGECTGREWEVEMNGIWLDAFSFVAKPIDHPYDAGLGNRDQYACFKCPSHAVREGTNKVDVTLRKGSPAVLRYLDLVLP